MVLNSMDKPIRSALKKKAFTPNEAVLSIFVQAK